MVLASVLRGKNKRGAGTQRDMFYHKKNARPLQNFFQRVSDPNLSNPQGTHSPKPCHSYSFSEKFLAPSLLSWGQEFIYVSIFWIPLWTYPVRSVTDAARLVHKTSNSKDATTLSQTCGRTIIFPNHLTGVCSSSHRFKNWVHDLLLWQICLY